MIDIEKFPLININTEVFQPCYITNIWDKVFKSGLSKFCGRQSLKNLLRSLLNTLCRLYLKT